MVLTEVVFDGGKMYLLFVIRDQTCERNFDVAQFSFHVKIK